jgi:drug/metabolite transporter (DMT)-like permease
LTAMSYIFGALLAKFFLHEDVTWMRWVGTVVIVIGIVFVALDGNPRTFPGDPPRERPFLEKSIMVRQSEFDRN